MQRRVFITGSSDGLGFLAGQSLVAQGHAVTLHARTEAKADSVRARLPGCEAVVTGDVSTVQAMRDVAAQVNALGRYDAVIHNVAVGTTERREMTPDGLTQLFAVNVVAPYVLTALMTRPDRLVYMTSDMHEGGSAALDDPQWASRRWNASQAYSDSKLHDLTLALAVARRWPAVRSNAVNPGWVPTRMGGAGAPDRIEDGVARQVWLAVSDDAQALVSGQYVHHRTVRAGHRAAGRVEVQEALLAYLAHVTGVALP